MDTPRRFSRSHRWAIALWLALLLPFAQAAAVRHKVFHVGDGQTQRQGLVTEPCELCLAAAALGGLAPPAAPVAIAPPAPAESGPVVPALASPVGRPAVAYRAQAPPSLMH